MCLIIQIGVTPTRLSPRLQQQGSSVMLVALPTCRVTGLSAWIFVLNGETDPGQADHWRFGSDDDARTLIRGCRFHRPAQPRQPSQPKGGIMAHSYSSLGVQTMLMNYHARGCDRGS